MIILVYLIYIKIAFYANMAIENLFLKALNALAFFGGAILIAKFFNNMTI